MTRSIMPNLPLQFECDMETRTRFFEAFDHKDVAERCPPGSSCATLVSLD
jgi:hypothetical protein